MHYKNTGKVIYGNQKSTSKTNDEHTRYGYKPFRCEIR